MKRLYILLTLLLFLISCSEHKSKEKNKKNNIFYDKAFEFRDNNEPDSAFVYFSKAQELFLQQKDSLDLANCYLNMAIIANNKGDYFSGQEFSLNASSYFNPLEKDQHLYIVANLNVLGNANYNLNYFSMAIDNYEKALKYNPTIDNILKLKNNIANALRREKKYAQAIVIYQNILEQNISSTEFAKVLSNFALTKWLQNPNYNAAPEFLKALQIREKENFPIEKNASYSNLTDYYMNTRPDLAYLYAKKMYQVAKITNNPDDKLQALQKLIKVGSPQLTKSYFESYIKLDDSVQTARNAAKNQFALIRFEVEKSKTDIQRLEKENTFKKYQIVTRELILLATVLLFISITIIFMLWYKKRKQRIELEAQNAIKENQFKTSKKVHDVVANGLYRIMTKLDTREILKDDPIVDEIEELYEKSRDISYERAALIYQNFNDKISDLLKSFSSNSIKILIVGNELKLWEKLNIQTQFELEHILQELMVNMKKHSNASIVVIKFEVLNEQININYTDDGIGIDNGTVFNNGLTNTGNRINSIGGTINFEPNKDKGLKINISFPIT